ncbi:unnamed protein product [Rotaria sordida]|uniref:Uncharacterized protein n=1 Tax=Rotaria sordida TaxID=392033 RepID=A0A818URY9_9BILA|nr:unnamed protein product [Rotaria sordida]CAF3695788.1 unnamed protein product [Rotaria sordida]
MSASTSSDRNQESPGNLLDASGVAAQQKLGQQGSSDSSTHQLGEGDSRQQQQQQQQHKLGQNDSEQHQHKS